MSHQRLAIRSQIPEQTQLLAALSPQMGVGGGKMNWVTVASEGPTMEGFPGLGRLWGTPALTLY